MLGIYRTFVARNGRSILCRLLQFEDSFSATERTAGNMLIHGIYFRMLDRLDIIRGAGQTNGRTPSTASRPASRQYPGKHVNASSFYFLSGARDSIPVWFFYILKISDAQNHNQMMELCFLDEPRSLFLFTKCQCSFPQFPIVNSYRK